LDNGVRVFLYGGDGSMEGTPWASIVGLHSQLNIAER